jgi:alkylation response protein AidB-like acyl-CoA dehydrogenase
MKFYLSHEQVSIQEAVEQVVKGTLGDGGLHEIIGGKRDKEALLWDEMSGLGVPGIAIPEAYGGQGLGVLELALVSEILGYTAAPGPFMGHTLAALAIALGGDESQRKAWLPRLASGESIASVAFAEPGGRWLPDQWTLNAGKTLNGAKTHVVCAAQAQLFVVGLGGGELGVVDANSAGVSQEPLEGADSTRPISQLRFENAPFKLLPTDRGVAQKIVDAGLAMLAADAFGVGRRCVEMATEYAKQREQFGVKIAQFQALRHQLADMALEIEPCRGLYWFAAHNWDQGDEDVTRMVALAKSHITDRSLQVARDSIEAHGGIGFTWEYDSHIWLKRAMFNWAWLGSAAIHRARVAELAAAW